MFILILERGSDNRSELLITKVIMVEHGYVLKCFANMTSNCIVLVVPLTLNARVEFKSIREKKMNVPITEIVLCA